MIHFNPKHKVNHDKNDSRNMSIVHCTCNIGNKINQKV
jgi:hypothetical protein